MAMRKPGPITHACSECGGSNVEVAVWYSPNTGHVGEEFHDYNYQKEFSAGWCHDCEEHVNVVDLECPFQFDILEDEARERLVKQLGTCPLCEHLLDGEGNCTFPACKGWDHKPPKTKHTDNWQTWEKRR
jgi:hypothetical protein